MGQTYQLRATESGSLSIELDPNPFGAMSTERFNELSWQFGQKTHVAREQNNYNFDAENIIVLDGEDQQCYVLLTLVFPDHSHRELVWPSRAADLAHVIELLKELVTIGQTSSSGEA